MLQGAYYSGNTSLKLLSFGGKARTYLTYTGVTKEDMERYGRRYHTEGQYKTSKGPFVLEDGTHVDYYDDQTDNYLQINNQLVFNHRFDERWALNATAFYTYGYGYYKQYKPERTLAEYLNLATDVEEADLIRKKIMRNHLGGLNAAAHYTTQRLDLSFGGSWSYYTCPHWGTLEWVDGLDRSQTGGRWYDNDADKQDANLFVRANWNVARGLNLFADLQYRYVSYKADGVNDNAIWRPDGSVIMQPIEVDKQYRFFNPRAGVNYRFAGRHTLYASFAIAQKEPTRSDFTDRYMFAESGSYPSSEKMYDYEIGYTYAAPRLSLGINLYYMKYKDQLVPTGRINDGYDALNDNVPDSYRRGIELSASWRVADWFTASANATFSQNRIEHYVNRVVDSGISGNVAGKYGYHTVEMGTTRIAYSPETMASTIFDFHYRGFGAVLHTQYVGEQYFTNYANPDMRLDAYCVTNLDLSYTLRTKAARSVRFGVAVYNLFDSEYESNGYGYSDAYEGEQTDYAYYFPQAPLHVLANVTVTF